jgi:uncharacterized protein
MTILLDTGPWVALMSRSDHHHAWAKQQFAAHSGPMLTCEAVIAETCFLLARAGLDAGRALEMLERGVVQIGLSLTEQATAVRNLYSRYDNVPASLADACLIRMSELHEPCHVLTLDGDFHIYRRHGRKAIAVIAP